MALVDNDTEGRGRYLRIINGSLCEKADSPLNDKYVLFETINPTTSEPVSYYVRKYKRAEGRIQRLERVELEGSKIYGYNLHMEDEDGAFSIFFKDDAKTTDRLLKCFENIDLNEDVTISVWKDEEDRPAISFSQNGENVKAKWFTAKDGTGNLPEPKKVKGKWDYSAVGEFLYNNTMENIIPQFVQPEVAQAAAAGANDDLNF
jgi:hypothetical protein